MKCIIMYLNVVCMYVLCVQDESPRNVTPLRRDPKGALPAIKSNHRPNHPNGMYCVQQHDPPSTLMAYMSVSPCALTGLHVGRVRIVQI